MARKPRNSRPPRNAGRRQAPHVAPARQARSTPPKPARDVFSVQRALNDFYDETFDVIERNPPRPSLVEAMSQPQRVIEAATPPVKPVFSKPEPVKEKLNQLPKCKDRPQDSRKGGNGPKRNFVPWCK